MAEGSAADLPAKHPFGQLARRPMPNRMRSPSPAPAVPTQPRPLSAQQIEEIALAAHEAFEERAAIMEFDGDMKREAAEAAARRLHPLIKEHF